MSEHDEEAAKFMARRLCRMRRMAAAKRDDASLTPAERAYARAEIRVIDGLAGPKCTTCYHCSGGAARHAARRVRASEVRAIVADVTYTPAADLPPMP